MQKSQYSQFAHYGVATVYEAAGQKGLIDAQLIQIHPGSKATGPARTVLCGQADNLMVHAALAEAQPGEVLIITMPEPEAVSLVGDLLAFQARVRQVAAILVNGAVRDTDALRKLGLPIWSRWVRARAATKNKVGVLNQPVQVCGVTIANGDIIVLDADGAVAIPQAEAENVLQAAKQREAREEKLVSQLQQGALTYDLHGLRAVVEGTKS